LRRTVINAIRRGDGTITRDGNGTPRGMQLVLQAVAGCPAVAREAWCLYGALTGFMCSCGASTLNVRPCMIKQPYPLLTLILKGFKVCAAVEDFRTRASSADTLTVFIVQPAVIPDGDLGTAMICSRNIHAAALPEHACCVTVVSDGKQDVDSTQCCTPCLNACPVPLDGCGSAAVPTLTALQDCS